MKILFCVGEKSGDLHASFLLRAIQKLDPTIKVFALGGPHLAAAGARIIGDITLHSTIGFVEPLLHIPHLLKAFRTLSTFMKKEKPDLVIAVDFQGFNMMVLKKAKKLGLRTAYYISPQEWQWGTEKGGRSVIQNTDLILSIFKEEHDFYTRLGGRSEYVGHPMLDLVGGVQDRSSFCVHLGLNKEAPIIGVFPGSRRQEIDQIYPLFLQVIKEIQVSFPRLQFVVSVADQRTKPQLEAMAKKWQVKGLTFFNGSSLHLIAHSLFSITKSGTITLEHGLVGTPAIVAYRFSRFSYWVIKMVFRKKMKELKFVSLPNLYMDEAVLPEFIQEAATKEALVKQALAWLKNASELDLVRHRLTHLKTAMGNNGAVQKSASAIINLLREPQ